MLVPFFSVIVAQPMLRPPRHFLYVLLTVRVSPSMIPGSFFGLLPASFFFAFDRSLSQRFGHSRALPRQTRRRNS